MARIPMSRTITIFFVAIYTAWTTRPDLLKRAKARIGTGEQGVTAINGKLADLADTQLAINGKSADLADTKPAIYGKSAVFADTKPAINGKSADFLDTKPAIYEKPADLADTKPAIYGRSADLADTKPAIYGKSADLANTKKAINEKSAHPADTKLAVSVSINVGVGNAATNHHHYEDDEDDEVDVDCGHMWSMEPRNKPTTQLEEDEMEACYDLDKDGSLDDEELEHLQHDLMPLGMTAVVFHVAVQHADLDGDGILTMAEFHLFVLHVSENHIFIQETHALSLEHHAHGSGPHMR